MVTIKQDSALKCETSYISLHQDQVDTVIRWLKEVKAEALEERRAGVVEAN